MSRDWSTNTEADAGRADRMTAWAEDQRDHDDGWFAGTPHDCETPNPGRCLECALNVAWIRHTETRTA